MRFTFVMEQTLGHVSFMQNIRTAFDADTSVDMHWLEVDPNVEAAWEKLPGVRENWSLRAGLRARAALRNDRLAHGRSDLYLFHTQVVSLLSSGWMRDPPPIVVSLDATPLNYDRVGAAYGHSRDPAALERLKFWLNSRAFQQANHVVTWSHWARWSLIEDYGVAAELVDVVPPGTDLGVWRTATDSAPADDAGKIRLLFVGGDFSRKGGRILLDVFARELAESCELHLVTKAPVSDAGPGVFIHRDIAPNSPRLRSLLASADVFVLPTLGDVHSIASVEAMAAGLPVVASDIGAIDEVVVDEQTGFLVPPGDERALAQALQRLLDDDELRKQMGQRGRARAEALFDSAKNANRLLSICKSVSQRERPTLLSESG